MPLTAWRSTYLLAGVTDGTPRCRVARQVGDTHLVKMTTRRSTTTDWPYLWPMLRSMGTAEDEQVAQATYEGLLQDPQWLIVVAECGDELLGYAAVQDYGPRLRATTAGRFGRLHDVYVVAGRRREGIGHSLMQAVEAWASGRVSYLHWQAHHERSAPFYERLGYRGDPCPQPDYPEFEVAYPQP